MPVSLFPRRFLHTPSYTPPPTHPLLWGWPSGTAPFCSWQPCLLPFCHSEKLLLSPNLPSPQNGMALHLPSAPWCVEGTPGLLWELAQVGHPLSAAPNQRKVYPNLQKVLLKRRGLSPTPACLDGSLQHFSGGLVNPKQGKSKNHQCCGGR